MKCLRGFWIKHREGPQVKSQFIAMSFSSVVFAKTTNKLVRFQVVGTKKKKKKKFIVVFMLTVVLAITLSLVRSGNVIYFVSGISTDHSRQASASKKSCLSWLFSSQWQSQHKGQGLNRNETTTSVWSFLVWVEIIRKDYYFNCMVLVLWIN